MLVGAFGVLRLPDLYARMSAATVATTMGLVFIMLGATVHFADAWATGRCVTILVFVFITSPVSDHMIGRAGYLTGVRLADKAGRDELDGLHAQNGDRMANGGPIRADGEHAPSASPFTHAGEPETPEE
jgi:multicomponent Na+:H+ antiporter subunit G